LPPSLGRTRVGVFCGRREIANLPRGVDVTAEVVVLNREAVALAADSAVTVAGADGQKIFTSANKIFGLSSTEPVGVMIYGAATILGVPWETVIKTYRTALGSKSHSTLAGYAEDFFSYLRDSRPTLFPEPAQVNHVARVAAASLHALQREIDRRVTERLAMAGAIGDREIGAILRGAVDELYSRVGRSPETEGLPPDFIDSLTKRYRSTVYAAIDHVFQNHRISIATRRKLLAFTFGLLVRHVPGFEPPTRTGLVIAGFGSTQVFPGIRSYQIDGMAADVLKMQPEDATDISHEETRAVVRAFAQGEMVYRFMEGVDPTYQEFVEQLVTELTTGYAQALVDQDQEDRAALPRPLSAAPEAGWACRRDRAQRRALRLQQRAQDLASDPHRGTEARRGGLATEWRV
jgi:hypothetical protein